ncbi:hypothetical protein EDB85DRAFT_1565394 [Lactarius pseudohatsudake]|nr:hypothetical protein EDB85DRAFT_1565394 [Lactarius pseudohatsudake]
MDGVVESPESVAAAAGSRMQTKSWRKALADEVEVRHNDDNDHKSDYDGGPRAHAISAPAFTDACRKKRTPASSSLGVLPRGVTFCHHCRDKTRRPKMRCMLIKASTDKSCRNLFFDLCMEKRYPELTFGRTAEEFECPGLLQLLRPKSGDPGTSQVPAPTKQRPTKTTTTTDAPVFDASWSTTAAFTVPGEPLGSAFLHGNKSAHRAPSRNPRPPLPLLPPPHCPRHITASPIPEPAQKQRTPAYVYWETAQDVGRLVSLRKTDRRRRPALLTPLDDGDYGDEDGNLDEGGDADADDGIWPGGYVVPVPAAQAEMARITPEEVERAIGAAFAIGGSA